MKGFTPTIGQVLIFQPRDTRQHVEEFRIVRIGRRWLNVKSDRSTGRVDRETLLLDGGQYTSPGRCYLSRADLDAEIYRQELFRVLRRTIEFAGPNDFTSESLSKALQALGVLPEAPPKCG